MNFTEKKPIYQGCDDFFLLLHMVKYLQLDIVKSLVIMPLLDFCWLA